MSPCVLSPLVRAPRVLRSDWLLHDLGHSRASRAARDQGQVTPRSTSGQREEEIRLQGEGLGIYKRT